MLAKTRVPRRTAGLLVLCILLSLLPAPAGAAEEDRVLYRLADTLSPGQTYVLAASNSPGDSLLLAVENGSFSIQNAVIHSDGLGPYLDAPGTAALWTLSSDEKLQHVESGTFLSFGKSNGFPVLQLKSSGTRVSYSAAGYGLSMNDYYLDLATGAGPVLTAGVPVTRIWLYEQITISADTFQCADDAVVIDYGLPVDIHVLDNDTLPEDAAITAVSGADELLHGRAEIVGSAIRYTPTDMCFSGVETFSYTVNGAYTAAVTVIPAPSILYEEDFVTFTDGSSSWSTVTDPGAAAPSEPILQEESRPGQSRPYGSDGAYETGLGYSLGCARTVCVCAADQSANAGSWPSAQFTFTGTGFELISRTDNTSGLFLASVTDQTTGETLYRWARDLYYGQEGVLYQVPALKSPVLPYGTYQVTLTPLYAPFFDHTGCGSYDFCVDAVRIHNPAQGLDGDYYVQDGGGWMACFELRDLLLQSRTDAPGVITDAALITEGETVTDLCTLANLIPKNEVYLAPGQAVSFTLAPGAPEGYTLAGLHLAGKALDAPTSAAVTLSAPDDGAVLGTQTLAFSSAAELYRVLPLDTPADRLRITITNAGSGRLSLTNLRANYQPTDPGGAL